MTNKVSLLAILLSLFGTGFYTTTVFAASISVPASVTASLMATAGASASLTSLNQSMLAAASSVANCKTTFTRQYINDTIALNPTAASSLNARSTSLAVATAHLSMLQNQSNPSAFSTYITGSYTANLSGAASTVSAIAHNLSGSQKTTLLNQYNTLSAAYVNCTGSSAKRYDQEKLADMNANLAEKQHEIDLILTSGLGDNTTGLSQVLVYENTTVVTPFAKALAATNTTTGYAALENAYCLDNGCASGINGHMAARWSIAKLTMIGNFQLSQPNITDQGTILAAFADLNNATKVLVVVGTAAYSNGQNVTVWSNITAAHILINAVVQQQGAWAIISSEVDHLNKLANETNEIVVLGLKVNNTAMLNLIAQANLVVIGGQEKALYNATNVTAVQDAINDYCFDNSCPNDTNFHLGRKLQLATLNATLGAIEAKAQMNNITLNQSILSEIEVSISNASSLINAAGTNQLTPQQDIQIENYFVTIGIQEKMLIQKAVIYKGSTTGSLGGRVNNGTIMKVYPPSPRPSTSAGAGVNSNTIMKVTPPTVVPRLNCTLTVRTTVNCRSIGPTPIVSGGGVGSISSNSAVGARGSATV